MLRQFTVLVFVILKVNLEQNYKLGKSKINM